MNITYVKPLQDIRYRIKETLPLFAPADDIRSMYPVLTVAPEHTGEAYSVIHQRLQEELDLLNYILRLDPSASIPKTDVLTKPNVDVAVRCFEKELAFVNKQLKRQSSGVLRDELLNMKEACAYYVAQFKDPDWYATLPHQV